MQRNEILCIWAIAVYLLWLFPYTQDPTKFWTTLNGKKGHTSLQRLGIQVYKDLEWAPDSKTKFIWVT